MKATSPGGILTRGTESGAHDGFVGNSRESSFRNSASAPTQPIGLNASGTCAPSSGNGDPPCHPTMRMRT